MREWLSKNGLGGAIDLFEAADIGMDIICDLDEDDLKEIGISLGHRKRFLRAVAKLRPAQALAPVPVEHASPPSKALSAPASASAVLEPTPIVAASAERRQVTIVFADMVGSTALSERLDAEELYEVVCAYQAACIDIIVKHGGHIAKFLGDGVLAYFGFPNAREDDPERSVRAGLDLIEHVSELCTVAGSSLQIRVGIDTGLVVIGDLIGNGGGIPGVEDVVGETPNRAARLQDVAAPGTVVISLNTRRLLGNLFDLEDLGVRTLKGFADPVPLFHVLGESQEEDRSKGSGRQDLTTLVGRDHELEMIVQRWELARAGEGQVLLLSGEGGIGKSRLLDSLIARIGKAEHTRLRYFCSQFYSQSSLYPVIDQIKRAAGLRREDSDETKLAKLAQVILGHRDENGERLNLLAALCSVDASSLPLLELSPLERKERTFALMAEQAELLAKGQPLLLLLEDAHWIDPTTVSLVQLIMERLRQLPALILITARPEFQPSWTGVRNMTTLQLNRLGRAQALELMQQIAGGKKLPEIVQAKIISKADGVPLYVEELTKSMLEAGILVERDKDWELIGELPEIAIPASLHDSLTARLDRLTSAKEVALWASALGRTFTSELLEEVAPFETQMIRAALDKLLDAEMLYRHGRAPDEIYEFRHALIREAAYKSMLRTKRQQLHARIAEVIAKDFPEIAETQPEILAHRYKEAGSTAQAITYALRAGDRTAERYVSPEARSRYLDALALVRGLKPSEANLRIEVNAITKCASVAADAREIDHDLEELRRAEIVAKDLDDPQLLAKVLYWIGRLSYVSGRFADAIVFADRSLLLADEAGGEDGDTAQAVNLLARIHCLRGEPKVSVEHAARNVEQMRRLGDRIEEAAMSGVHAFALGTAGRFDEAFTAGQQGIDLAEALDHLPTRAAAHFFNGVVHGWRGDVEVASRSTERALYYADQAGDLFRRYVALGWRGEAYLHAGKLDSARSDLEHALELAGKMGVNYHKPAFEAFLALVLDGQGEQSRAYTLVEQAWQAASEAGELWAQSLAARAMGSILAHHGDEAQAVNLLEEAMAIQDKQGLRADLARTRLALAPLLKGRKAKALFDMAIDSYAEMKISLPPDIKDLAPAEGG